MCHVLQVSKAPDGVLGSSDSILLKKIHTTKVFQKKVPLPSVGQWCAAKNTLKKCRKRRYNYDAQIIVPKQQ